MYVFPLLSYPSSKTIATDVDTLGREVALASGEYVGQEVGGSELRLNHVARTRPDFIVNYGQGDGRRKPVNTSAKDIGYS